MIEIKWNTDRETCKEANLECSKRENEIEMSLLVGGWLLISGNQRSCTDVDDEQKSHEWQKASKIAKRKHSQLGRNVTV